jgi:cytochrome c-type biogenesis protein CcmH
LRILPFLALLAAHVTPSIARDYAQEALPDARQEAAAIALMDSIRCVVCQGQPISGSNADLAGDMRRMIRERIAAGEKPEDIRVWLIGRYGDWVSFKPQVKASTTPLWGLPLLALALGVWLTVRRLKLKRD